MTTFDPEACERQFTAFFEAIHEREPFPWQKRLAVRVCDPAKGWPRVIALPTAAGNGYQSGSTTVTLTFHAVQSGNNALPTGCATRRDRRGAIGNQRLPADWRGRIGYRQITSQRPDGAHGELEW